VLFALEGEVAAVARTRDWAATGLGPLEKWPAELRAAVSVCLASRFPMTIAWGPELALLYNDAYIPLLGRERHPAALGQPARQVYGETWPLLAPLAERAWSGEATWAVDLPLPRRHAGRLREGFVTFSCSPIRDPAGETLGLFCAAVETTERAQLVRRARTLARVGGAGLAAGGADAAERALLEALEGSEDVARCELLLGERAAPPSLDLGEPAGAGEPRTLLLPLGAEAQTLGYVRFELAPLVALDDGCLAFLHALAERMATALATGQARDRAVRELRDARILAAAGALNWGQDERLTLESIVWAAVPDLADWAILRVDGDDRGLRVSARASDVEHRLADSAQGSSATLLNLPLQLGERALGAVILGVRTGRAPFTEQDARVARRLAGRAAVSIENARLGRERDEAHALLDALFDTAPVGLGFWDRELRYQRVNRTLASMNGVPPQEHIGRTIPDVLPDIPPDVPELMARVVREGRAELDHETTGRTPARPGEDRTWSVSYYPVRDPAGDVVGIGTVRQDVTETRRAQAAEQALREALARGLRVEHEIAATLQRALLPEHLPPIPGLATAGLYRTADGEHLAGGDFYDLFPLADGQWLAVIGDVVGKGERAAAVTGMVRHTLRTRMGRETDPVRLIGWLNTIMRRQYSDLSYCTLCLAVLGVGEDPCRVRVVLAGHPPALLLSADGEIRALGQPGSPPGLLERLTLHAEDSELRTGDTLILYTDGLLPRETITPATAPHFFPHLLTDLHRLAPRDLVERLFERATAAHGKWRRDDTAILAIRPAPR
jgi:PAS domain S-box-containing protein